jgi:hypothetical protein
MDVQNAVTELAQALKSDEAFFYAYQSNIAMAFYDEARRHDIHISHEKLHEIANNGAKNFLQLFVGQAVPATPVEEPKKETVVEKVVGKFTGKKSDKATK